ncbi:MAG: DNA primase noncatalytic subunit PriX [Candidatus Micrarchaeia archaeon]
MLGKILEIAYKYPFSKEAKEAIKNLPEANKIEQKYLELGKLRLTEALDKRVIEFSESDSDELRLSYLISYVYARMLASALGGLAVSIFAEAEARRVASALASETVENIKYIGEELDIKIGTEGDMFLVSFGTYLENAPKKEEYLLIHQRLSKGIVYIERYKLIGLLENASRKAILQGLPIAKRALPREILDFSKGIKIPVEEVKISGDIKGKYAWIEKLLSHPLPDFRHRVVNLILAPYFTNIMGLSEEEAIKRIIQYIEKCKEINPDTKVGEQYITYQVKYAKAKGLKPLSMEKAKEMLSGIIDFGEFN